MVLLKCMPSVIRVMVALDQLGEPRDNKLRINFKLKTHYINMFPCLEWHIRKRGVPAFCLGCLWTHAFYFALDAILGSARPSSAITGPNVMMTFTLPHGALAAGLRQPHRCAQKSAQNILADT